MTLRGLMGGLSVLFLCLHARMFPGNVLLLALTAEQCMDAIELVMVFVAWGHSGGDPGHHRDSESAREGGHHHLGVDGLLPAARVHAGLGSRRARQVTRRAVNSNPSCALVQKEKSCCQFLLLCRMR